MMTLFGRTLFWLTWPLLWLYSPLYLRPRLFLVCGEEFLGVKPYFGNGAWQLPGGGMHKGESELQAAVRELAEETGVEVAPENVRLLVAAGSYKERGLRMRYSIFAAEITQKPALVPQKNEIGEAAWLPLQTGAANYLAHVRTSIAAFRQ